MSFFFFQAEDGIRDIGVTGVQTCALPIWVNFIGGFSALVQKGCTPSDILLMKSIPEAMNTTERVCSSVNVGTSRNGLNMDAIKMMGETIKETAKLTQDRDGIGCAKLVVFCKDRK